MEDKNHLESIAKRIKELREKNNESQEDLAKAIGCLQNNISKIEKGGSLTVTNLLKIALHYDVSMDYLCKGKGGIDVLDTIDKYIHYKLSKVSGLKNDTCLIPHIEINSSLYKYLQQKTYAEHTTFLPNDLREQWLEKATVEFNSNKIKDNYNDFVSFVILKDTVLGENQDIIKHIEEHIIG